GRPRWWPPRSGPSSGATAPPPRPAADVSAPLAERHEHGEAWGVPDHAGDVALAGEILGQHHIARPDPRHRAVAHLDLRLAGERDGILPARRAVPGEHVTRGRGPERDPLGGEHG